MMYNKDVNHYFFESSHAGEVRDQSLTCLEFTQGEITQGSKVVLTLGINQNKEIIKAAFKAYGSPYVIAGMAWLCEQLQGKNKTTLKESVYEELVEKFEIVKTQLHHAIQIELINKQVLEAFKQF